MYELRHASRVLIRGQAPPHPLHMSYFPSATTILSAQRERPFYQEAFSNAYTPAMWLPEGRDLPGLPAAVSPALGWAHGEVPR